jgi:hypothetical protein
MVLSSLCRIAVTAFFIAIAFGVAPECAVARELATAQGTIAISEAHSGFRAPLCGELVIEARDALDNHLIAESKPTTDEVGTCRYALSVPAQVAVWLRVQAVLVDGARAGGAIANPPSSARTQASSRSVALRFTIIAPTTYFFGPGEQKTILLTY